MSCRKWAEEGAVHQMLMRALVVALTLLPAPLLAKGCIRGAAIGGVAGHYVGRGHALGGAVVGCAVGHHRATVQARQQRAAAAQAQPPHR